MAWMRLEQAAAVLEMSPRTIRRRAAIGDIDSKRDGRAMLYQVEDGQAVANVTELGRQLSTIVAGTTIQSRDQTETLAGAVASFERAERQAIRAVRWCLGITAVVCIGAVALVLVRTDQHHAETVVHVAENSRLKAELGHAVQAVSAADQRTVEANRRTAAAEAQAATDSARIVQINEALAGLSIPVEPTWTTRVAGR